MDGKRGKWGRCAGRSGFSLLEVAIVLALLVVIAAMVMPAIGPRLDRRAAIEARARITAAVVRAQAEASLVGEPVRVLAVGGTVQRLVSEPQAASESTSGTKPPRRPLGELPAACAVRAPSADDRVTEPEAFGAPRASDDDAGEIVLGWALPDGTFANAGSIELATPRGTAFITIDAWTGRVLEAPSGSVGGSR